MKKTLDEIAKLANSSLFLNNNAFPNFENAEKCRHSLALISDLTNRILSEEESVSVTYLKTLKINFIKYMRSEELNIPRFLLPKRNIKQIISHLGDIELYDYPICESKDETDIEKIFFLIEKGISSDIIGNEFSICLLKVYYSFYNKCSELFLNNIKFFLSNHFTKEKYYLLQADYIPIYSKLDKGEDNYQDFLRNIKINTNFLSTNFFQDIWYIWCLTRKPNTYSDNFFKINKTRINAEREDVRKCILAVITCQVNKNASKDTIITTYLLPMFGSLNPADSSFWQISDQNLKSQYSTFLSEAPKIYYKYFTKTFLEAFFLVLSTGGSSYEQERAVFWLNYIDEIEDFKIGVTTYKDQLLRSRLSRLPGDFKMYLAFYRNCRMRIYKDSDPAALLMTLNNVLAIEFTENGNAAYIYQKDNEFAQQLFNKWQIDSVSDLKSQFSGNGFIERIIHRDYWQPNAARILNRY